MEIQGVIMKMNVYDYDDESDYSPYVKNKKQKDYTSDEYFKKVKKFKKRMSKQRSESRNRKYNYTVD